MQTNNPLQRWIDHLRCIAPIAGLVHVGAGAGSAASHYADWGVPFAVLIEAEESLYDKLAVMVSEHPGWSAHLTLVSDNPGEKDFYLASNPNENGVLAPDRFSGFWRNLKTREQRRLNATTLDRLLTASGHPPKNINWAFIDCLPALPVLQGAGQYIRGCDVIVVRVVLDEAQLPGIGATKTEVDAFLSTRGYRCLAWEAERQPAIGSALYLRDWKASVHAHRAEHQKRVEQLTKSRDEQARLATERQGQMDQISKARDEQGKLAAERKTQLDQMTSSAVEHQKRLEQLTKSRDEQAKLAQGKQLEMDKITTLLQEERSRVAQLECQLADMDSRYRLLNEEIIRAEGQINLIKSVLLREAEA